MLVAVAVAGCRIGFDERRAPDAGVVSPPRFVQTESTMNPGSATIALALPSGVAAGNLVLCAIDYLPASAGTLVSVTDDKGNTYTPAGPFDGNGEARHYLAWTIAQTSGPTTVTATLSAAPGTFLDLRLHEYENVDPVAPVHGAASATGTSTATDGALSAPVTTTTPNELVFGFLTFFGFGSGGTGFTIRSTFDGDVTEDMVATSPGEYRAKGTATNPDWTATVTAIRGR